jgi:Fe-S oxidoreductase
MNQRIKGRKNFPTDEVDPENFIEDAEILQMVDKLDETKFIQKDFLRLFNCVQCGECDTDVERILLKQKFLEDGNTFEDLDSIIECFNIYRSPYPSNTMRIKRPSGIPQTSDTLFFMGCLSTIRIPKYTEHALEYLLKQNVDFTILEKEICCGWHLKVSGLRREYETCQRENTEILNKFKRIICLCPACYKLFGTDYNLNKDIEIRYISEYLKPSESSKSGMVSIQHLCHLMNMGKEKIAEHVEKVLVKSGYEVSKTPHWCCGGGIGYMHRTDVIDKIARKRMQDHKGNFCTTYCVSCWWILRRYSKLCRIEPKAKDLFELLL